MATVDGGGARTKSKPPRPKRICFSFATYASNLISRLKSSNVAIEEGLSDKELSLLESKFNFSFPPDLRSILQQGLPVSPGFPNWRSSSDQQLQILLNLPVSSILRRVTNNSFWHPSWGSQPNNPVDAARRIMDDAPLLVPIYRHFYIPSSSNNVAGNPVFYVDHGGDVKVASFDVCGFFRDAGFLLGSEEVEVPMWAAKKARGIGVWSELADGRGENSELRGCKWWWEGGDGKLGGCMEGVLRKLREGGWKEEEIREMLMPPVNENDDVEEEEDKKEKRGGCRKKEEVVRHVKVLSWMLLGAGWSREDVVYSLGEEREEEEEHTTTAKLGVNINHH